MTSRHLAGLLMFAGLTLSGLGARADLDFAVKLASGRFTPQPMRLVSPITTATEGEHILIQFKRVLTDSDRQQLFDNGIELLDYIPNFTYTARVRRAITQRVFDQSDIRWFGTISPPQKVSPLIDQQLIPAPSRRDDGRVVYTVVLHRDEPLDAWADRFQTDFGAEIVGLEPLTNAIELVVPEQKYVDLAALDAVVWIEPAIHVHIELNDGNRLATKVETVQAAPYSLTGAGVVVAQWDGGAADNTHPDLSGRVTQMDAAAISTHATHVAGTVMGGGVSSGGKYRGMAPDARLLTQLWWNSASEANTEYGVVITFQAATISTNSWGYGVSSVTSSACDALLGNYYSVNGTLDEIVRGSAGAPISIVYSAGNERSTVSTSCGSLGYTYNTTIPPGTAKNVITVGAINSNNNTMTSFSSWGPTDDGRMKPDVVGPGCQTGGDWGVTSTRPTSGYTVMCGTSMSAPTVAGILALLTQAWRDNVGGQDLLASTYKGILINSAVDLGLTGPDFQYGHGAVDALAAVDKINSGAGSYTESEIATGEVQSFEITVPAGAPKLKVTLVWDDPGGTGIGGGTLINDLDLKLVDPFGSETLPWIADPAAPTFPAVKDTDRVNNVETAEVSNPAPGLWQAVVTGFNIPQGPQKFSLVFTPDGSYTPNQQVAVAVFKGADLTELPGQAAQVDFDVSNVGLAADSIQVQIADSQGWLGTTVDTVVLLAPYDSTHFSVSAMVPAEALAGDSTVVTCHALSLTDSITASQRQTVVSAAAVYGVVATVPVTEDTVSSPESYPFSVTVRNTGNATDQLDVTPSDDFGWVFTPSSQAVFLNAGDSATVTFSLLIPSAVPDLTEDTVHIEAASAGPSDSTSFVLVVQNAIFPPTLLSPAPAFYSTARVYDFSWSGNGDSYTLYLATDTQMVNLVRVYNGLTDTAFSMPTSDSLADGLYYWAVRSFVGSDSSSFQFAPNLLGVDNVSPVTLEPISPDGPGYVSDANVNLVFQPAAANSPEVIAPEYNIVELSTQPDFSADLVRLDSVADFTVSLAGLISDNRWYWHVERVDQAGNSSGFSAMATFLLDTTPPIVPTLVTPSTGATVNSDTILFRWTGTPPAGHETSPEYYFVHVSTDSLFGEFNVFASFVYADSLPISSAILENQTDYYWRVKAFDSAGFFSAYTPGQPFSFVAFVCGDVDNSGGDIDIADLTVLIDHLFIGFTPLPIPQAADVDASGTVDIADLTLLIDHLFINFSVLTCE